MPKGLPEEHGHINPWLIAVAVMSATFMEVLDTTVVNVSLPHIAGSLSSTPDEATWTLTSYLVANAIVLPMTGWLANQFGRKRLLLGSVAGFTLASFFCGFAPTLPFLIIFRVIQGATGGGLQPLSQAILMESFSERDRGKAMGFWGLGIVVAPMLGPVLGGWLTDNFTWRWVFYINIPIGIMALILIKMFVFDPDYIGQKSEKVDYWGIGLLVVGIAALQIALDKGQQEDWFGSHFISTLVVVAVVSLAALVIRELITDHPIVDLRIFKRRTYAAGVFLMTILGFVLYGSTVLLPLLMQTLLGYTAFQAGLTTMPRGAASFVAMPLVGIMLTRFEPRKMLFFGMAGMSTALYFFSRLSLSAGYTDFMWPMVLQGVCTGMVFIPLTTVTNGPIPKEQMGNATSLFNLMRNIGASIGIASVTTMLARQQQVHTSTLGAHINPYNPGAQSMLRGMQQMMMNAGSDPVTATKKAYAAAFGMVQQQAAMMAYNDAFLLLAGLGFAMLPLIFIMKKPPKSSGPVAMH
jgi:DHA2 family multidrug resistance protein